MSLEYQALHEDRLREIRRDLQREPLRIEALGRQHQARRVSWLLNRIGGQLIAMGERLQTEPTFEQQQSKARI